MIIFFLILTTLIDQLCDKSIYRPYLRLMTGFMLISLMMQPVSYYLSNEDIVTQAISTAVKGENNPAFLDGAKEEKQNQIKEQITTLFSQYDLKVLDVDSKVNEKGTIEKIDIGGISLIRAGAKNFKDVVIVPSKAEYGVLLDILNKKGAQTDIEDRRMFATRAFGVSSHYDTAIHAWFEK